jgi:hypothetical protein
MGVLTNLVSSLASSLPGKAMLFGEAGQISESFDDLKQNVVKVLQNRCVVYSAGAYALYYLGQTLFSPVRHIRRNAEVGYITEENQQKMERANDVRRRRQTGDLPPVYPNGWYCIMPAHELPKKGI